MTPQYKTPSFSSGGGGMASSMGVPSKVKTHIKAQRVNGARKSTSGMLPKSGQSKR